MLDFPHFPLDSFKCPWSCSDHQTCEIWEEANWTIKIPVSMPPYCMYISTRNEVLHRTWNIGNLPTLTSNVCISASTLYHIIQLHYLYHYDPFLIIGSCLQRNAPLELSICIVRIDFDAVNIWQPLQALEVFTSAACHQPYDLGLHRDELCLVCRPASPCPEIAETGSDEDDTSMVLMSLPSSTSQTCGSGEWLAANTFMTILRSSISRGHSFWYHSPGCHSAKPK